MKFVYEYRTSDNVRHEGVIAASTREAAFAALRAQGIRPGCLYDAPGFFNKLFGKGKRWLAIGFLALALVGSIVYTSTVPPPTSNLQPDSPLPRHQIYGDPALMEEYERGDFAEVFDHPGERMLAAFAQPGRAIRSTFFSNTALLKDCLEHEIVFRADEPRESVELKRIVLWMKEELKNYLSVGHGTTETYFIRLEERQIAEARIYEDTVTELKTERDFDAWERKNDNLRKLGLRTIPLPSRDE